MSRTVKELHPEKSWSKRPPHVGSVLDGPDPQHMIDLHRRTAWDVIHSRPFLQMLLAFQLGTLTASCAVLVVRPW